MQAPISGLPGEYHRPCMKTVHDDCAWTEREMTPIRSSRRAFGAVGAVLAVVMLLSGCTPPPVATGTTVTVASAQRFFSYNPKTVFGNATANSNIVAATNSQFSSYDNEPKLVNDESFGHYQVVRRDPFTVKYTIKPGVRWSDGAAVDAADLLLAWAANSGSLNTKGFEADDYVDANSGQYTRPLPAGVVHFDASGTGGLRLVTKTPVIGDGGRSLTLEYDSPFADWRLALEVGVAAHVVAEHALGVDGAQKAKTAMITAIQTDDTAKLAKIARFWNTGFNFTAMPKDKSLVVGSGPYTITKLAGDHLTLTANHQYRGNHRPRFENVVVRYISDPLATVQAFNKGEVDVVAPQPTEEVTAHLLKVKGATVLSGSDAAFEHLDLQFSHSKNGTFDNPLVRQAFLATVPRHQILQQLVVPLQEDARLRDSQVFVPGAPEYANAVKHNGSAAYDEVDIPVATALLAQAGVVAPPVCILFDASSQRRVAEFALIRDSAALAGFVVTDCSSADPTKLLGVSGAYDAVLTSMRPTSLAVGATMAAFRSDSVVENTNFYSNPKVDALGAELDSTFQSEARTRLFEQVDTLVWADAYGLPLYQFPAVTAFNDRVRGVAPSPVTPNLLWNIWAWRPVVSAK